MIGKNKLKRCLWILVVAVGTALTAANVPNGITDRQLLNVYFKNPDVGIAYVMPSGKIVRANDALCRFFQYTESELMNKTWMELTVPKFVIHDQQLVDDIIAKKRSTYGMYKQYISQLDGVKWAHLHVAGVTNDVGNVVMMIATITPYPGKPVPEEIGVEVHLKRNAKTIASEWKWLLGAVIALSGFLIKVGSDFRIMKIKLEKQEQGLRDKP